MRSEIIKDAMAGPLFPSVAGTLSVVGYICLARILGINCHRFKPFAGNTMRPQIALALFCLAVVGGAYAQSENEQKPSRAISTSKRTSSSPVYMCTDAQGNKEYRNTGITKGCKKVNLPGLMSAPSSLKRPPIQTENAKFPKVEQEAQQKRDNDRKDILESELRAEQEKLTKLKEEYKGGEPDRLGDERNYAKYQERAAKLKEDIERSEKNVDALKREIGNLK